MRSGRPHFVHAGLPEVAAALLRARRAWRPRDAFIAERERWSLWMPVFLGIGIAGYFSLPGEPPGWLGPAGVPCAAVLAWALRKEPRGLLISAGIALLVAGFALAQLRTHRVGASVLAEPIRSARIVGRVVSMETRARGVRVVLDDLAIDGRPGRATPERARVTVQGAGGFRPGDRVSMRAALNPPPGPALPGAFDFGRQAFFQGFGAVGFSMSRVRVLSPAPAGFLRDVGHRISALRMGLGRAVLGEAPDASRAVAVALLTGDRGSIPERSLADMRDSGLAHLLAISGLHVGLFAGLLFAVARGALALAAPVALRFPIKKWAAMFSLAGAFAYLLMTGGTVPTQRAFLMIAIGLLAVVFERVALSMFVVAWAAACILVVAPESLLAAGFQMSFAAVVALISAYETMARRIRGFRSRGRVWRRVGLYMGGVVLTTLIAGLATAPFAAFHFNRVATFGLASNFLAVPVMALWIMPWAVVTYLLVPFGWQELSLAPMLWGIGLVLDIARSVASWPGAVHLVPALPPAFLALTALGGLWLCVWTTRLRLFGVLGLAAALSTGWLVDVPDVLVDERGRRFAVRLDDDRVAVSSTRTGFVRESWLRRLAVAEAAPWPKPGARAASDGRCDALGCLFRLKGRVVAFSTDPRAHPEDCETADVLVSSWPVRVPCRAPRVVIDRFDLWRRGAHAVYLDGGAVRVDAVGRRRGRRPWSP